MLMWNANIVLGLSAIYRDELRPHRGPLVQLPERLEATQRARCQRGIGGNGGGGGETVRHPPALRPAISQ